MKQKINEVAELKLINFTDTTFRDGQQSLIATRLSSSEILPVAKIMNDIGFRSMEVWGGATFDVCLRYLGEDPWERLRNLKKALPDTKTQMLLRGRNLLGYKPYPKEIVEMFVQKAAENGMDVFRIFDALNDVGNMKEAIEIAKKTGKHVQGAILYTISPVHDINHYTNVCRQLLELDVDSIALKDPSGIIRPSEAYNILSALVKLAGEKPVQFHAHCTSYMASMSYFHGLGSGISTLDCAMAPFAGGPSQPPLQAMLESLSGTEYGHNLNIEKIREANEMIMEIRKIKDVKSEIYIMDSNALQHQIPGGMISNLRSQLSEMKMLDKLAEVLKEVPNVRKDLGYPVLATPTSQIVGSQAVMNVMYKERYKVIPKEVKNYIKGGYGIPAGPIDPELVKRVENEKFEQENAKFNKKSIINELGHLYEQEEDILSYILFPEQARKYFEERYTQKYNVDLDLLKDKTVYPV